MGKKNKMRLSSDDIKKQSDSAYGQWAPQWRDHAKQHSKYEMKNFEDLRLTGLGKPLLLIGNGYSFEENIDLIKEYSGKIDILACDKTIGHLLERDIKVKYCMVCDANVSYEKYLEKYKDKLNETVLIMNVCGNPKFAENGNWKDKYFFVNKDVLNSEKEFGEISGCPNVIPAATNVSNAMLVFATQSDEKGRINFLGYDKLLLTGFDYSWKMGGSYYAFDKSAGGKQNYMRHALGWDSNGDFAYTSNNLQFSAKWLADYVKAFQLPVIQCGSETVTGLNLRGQLEKHIGYNYKPENAPIVKDLHEKIVEMSKKVKEMKDKYINTIQEHENNMFSTI